MSVCAGVVAQFNVRFPPVPDVSVAALAWEAPTALRRTLDDAVCGDKERWGHYLRLGDGASSIYLDVPTVRRTAGCWFEGFATTLSISCVRADVLDAVPSVTCAMYVVATPAVLRFCPLQVQLSPRASALARDGILCALTPAAEQNGIGRWMAAAIDSTSDTRCVIWPTLRESQVLAIGQNFPHINVTFGTVGLDRSTVSCADMSQHWGEVCAWAGTAARHLLPSHHSDVQWWCATGGNFGGQSASPTRPTTDYIVPSNLVMRDCIARSGESIPPQHREPALATAVAFANRCRVLWAHLETQT
jgi:hypothetical protein